MDSEIAQQGRYLLVSHLAYVISGLGQHIAAPYTEAASLLFVKSITVPLSFSFGQVSCSFKGASIKILQGGQTEIDLGESRILEEKFQLPDASVPMRLSEMDGWAAVDS